MGTKNPNDDVAAEATRWREMVDEPAIRQRMERSREQEWCPIHGDVRGAPGHRCRDYDGAHGETEDVVMRAHFAMVLDALRAERAYTDALAGELRHMSHAGPVGLMFAREHAKRLVPPALYGGQCAFITERGRCILEVGHSRGHRFP